MILAGLTWLTGTPNFSLFSMSLFWGQPKGKCFLQQVTAHTEASQVREREGRLRVNHSTYCTFITFAFLQIS